MSAANLARFVFAMLLTSSMVGFACHPKGESGDSCDFDRNCRRGLHCEGSSVCPPEVTCIWEGEPGICVPDACADDEECPEGYTCTGANPAKLQAGVCTEGVCPDPDDPAIHYVGGSDEDPSVCSLIFFACEPDRIMFGSDCGCGCIEPF